MKTNTIICLTAVLAILCSCGGQISSTDTDIHVAAYIWPSCHDDDPAVMEKWIDLATSHGIDTFIFDWYWFDGQPFLEGCLTLDRSI